MLYYLLGRFSEKNNLANEFEEAKKERLKYHTKIFKQNSKFINWKKETIKYYQDMYNANLIDILMERIDNSAICFLDINSNNDIDNYAYFWQEKDIFSGFLNLIIGGYGPNRNAEISYIEPNDCYTIIDNIELQGYEKSEINYSYMKNRELPHPSFKYNYVLYSKMYRERLELVLDTITLKKHMHYFGHYILEKKNIIPFEITITLQNYKFKHMVYKPFREYIHNLIMNNKITPENIFFIGKELI